MAILEPGFFKKQTIREKTGVSALVRENFKNVNLEIYKTFTFY